jgi:hypothetical protein
MPPGESGIFRELQDGWPFAGFCEGPQDAGNGFPAILRPGFARVEFQREPMLRRVSTQFRKSLSDKMLGFEKPAKGQQDGVGRQK